METAAHCRYPVGVDILYRILVSKDFFRCRYEWGGVRDYRFDCFEQRGNQFLVRLAHPVSLPADRMPAFARRLLPNRAELVTEFRWRPSADGYQAACLMTLTGLPARAEGSMTLRSADGIERAAPVTPATAEGAHACVQQIHLRVYCEVPVLGRKMERLVARQFDRILEGDYRHTLRYIEQAAHQE